MASSSRSTSPRTRTRHLQGRGHPRWTPRRGTRTGVSPREEEGLFSQLPLLGRLPATVLLLLPFSNATNSLICGKKEGGALKSGGTASRCDWPASCASFAGRLTLTVWWEVPALGPAAPRYAAHMLTTSTRSPVTLL